MKRSTPDIMNYIYDKRREERYELNKEVLEMIEEDY